VHVRRTLSASARLVGVGVALAIAACGSDPAASASEEAVVARPLSATLEDGIATFYDADGSGNCSYARTGDLDVVALAMPRYASSAACGACLEVTGPSGTVTVRVVDSCPGCASGGVDLDLSASAFAKIAAPEAGRVSVRWRAVSCAVSGTLAYHYKDGSSKYWTAIQVRNHRVPIASLAFEKNGAFVPMKRESYNYFVAEGGVGDTPNGLRVRVTASDGQTIEDTLPGPESDRTVSGARQLD
jgi:expansin (peptidoglycan-binding protein)